MAGVTDPVMRRLCLEQGAQLTFTEMVSAKGLDYGNGRTGDLLELAAGEERVGVQLFGHEPDVMARQAHAVREQLGERLAVIDVNMGCPARKIVSKGDGASLMERPNEARAVVAAVAAAVDVPVSVKMRRGFQTGCETAPELARVVADAGAAAVTVHGRFAAQLYRGQSDRGCIARVVRAVDVPVVGNGDVRCGADALALLDETGCAAVMVGRAAEGNPWVFADVRAALEGRAWQPPETLARIAMMRRHAHLLHAWEPRALVRMRKHACWYCAGMPGASAARGHFNAAKTLDEFDAVFDEMERRARAACRG